MASAAGFPTGGADSDYESLIECVAEAAALDDGTPDPRSIRIYRPAAALVIAVRFSFITALKLLRELRNAQQL